MCDLRDEHHDGEQRHEQAKDHESHIRRNLLTIG